MRHNLVVVLHLDESQFNPHIPNPPLYVVVTMVDSGEILAFHGSYSTQGAANNHVKKMVFHQHLGEKYEEIPETGCGFTWLV